MSWSCSAPNSVDLQTGHLRLAIYMVHHVNRHLPFTSSSLSASLNTQYSLSKSLNSFLKQSKQIPKQHNIPNKQNNTLILYNIMMHSILLSSVSVFFVVVLVLTTLTIDQSVQGLALAGIVRRVVKNNSSNNNIWGKRNSRSQQQRSSELPAMTMGNTISTSARTSTTNTQQVAPSISTTAAAAAVEGLISSPYIPFDADIYRQEMTDIVYQRNMERMNL